MDEQRQPGQPGSEPGSSEGRAGTPSAPRVDPPPPPPGWEGATQEQRASQGSQGQSPYGGPPVVPSGEADARQWSAIAHLLAGITTFVGPILVWAFKKDEHPFVKDQTTEALNFGITLILTQIVLGWVKTILGFTVILPWLANVLQFAVWVAGITLGIIGALRARDGLRYRYPISIRLIT